MADLAPSSSVTRIGSIAIIFAVALVAIYVANNFSMFGNIVSKKNAPSA